MPLAFLFPLVLPRQTREFWLGNRGSWTRCVLRRVPFFAPTRVSFCIETRGISGISIRTGQRFLCGYNAAGSSLIATLPLVSLATRLTLSYGDERFRSVSGFAESHHMHKTTRRLFIICLQCLWDRSIFSLTNQHQFSLPSPAVCVCVCVFVREGGLPALRLLAEDCEKAILPRGRQ